MYYYYPQGYPMCDQNGNVYNQYQQPQYPVQSQQQGFEGNMNKTYVKAGVGNQCAFVPDSPVSYNKLNITHWPSQDTKVPHPNGFTHTWPSQQ